MKAGHRRPLHRRCTGSEPDRQQEQGSASKKKRHDSRHGAFASVAASAAQQHFPAPDPYRAF
ncbi:hypothetical protein CJO71_27120 [Burkholderia ubonensis]|uniref:Uncharacterized protein n=1 Tax=Burkholderia ubonensis TaxID=101571 RepID=A0AB74D0R8_9BURK|nr:hypothetical protein CJO71_27120 [Burkholderia ubonensis]PAJ95166.1 hypothetical protein CJO69_07995 [Burkholderia ubonensis]PAJ99618.1 hypothetical protein CJO68_19140 [Burkholderia ubonensis]RQP70596.1 hypothetical protein DF015_29525 [Burkholderia ubonensis]RQP72455.1 hypothetical protein DF013_19500 [Burkholderia ubonensis]